jgi:hypothetical protein
MGNPREHIDKMAVRIQELENEIQDLEVEADRTISEAETEYRQQINELFLKEEALKHKLSKISAVSGNAWEDMKSGAELSWEVFNESVKNAFKK